MAFVCDVSFVEIAYFLQKNFEMPAAASEVVAVRLRETFHKYKLAAHPSYFAGIPRSTLNALLQVNRRAEGSRWLFELCRFRRCGVDRPQPDDEREVPCGASA
jgi:hypothetical protein